VRGSRKLWFVSVVLAALAVATGAAALQPASAIVAPRPVQEIALTGRSIGYVADAPKRLECGRIGFWNTSTETSFTVNAREMCTEETSTGQGISDISVATNRLLWLTYAGGNFRDWFLWTATTTRRTPRQLQFVSRPVESPPPIVLGPGTQQGIPYAVDRRIVYLGDDGRPIFVKVLAAPVRALASDSQGRFGITVAALLSNGEIVGLDQSGEEEFTMTFQPGAVAAVELDRLLGLAVQVGGQVTFPGGEVTLPPGARMVDFGQGRVLWVRAGDLGATTVAGKTRRLVDGTPERPASGQIEPQGIAWSVGRAVRWHPGAPP
jgi:hypothetical protein